MADGASAAEHALIAATLGYTTTEVIKIWMDAAPSLEDVRSTPPGDARMQQRMLDANYLGAGLSLILGGTISWLAHSWVPVLLSLVLLSFVSYWFKLVQRSDHSVMQGDSNG